MKMLNGEVMHKNRVVNHADILVCGAGIVGMAMALALLKKGFKPVIVAPKYSAQSNLGEVYHARIYAISHASQQLLDDLGIWSWLPAQRLISVEKMQIQGDQAGSLMLSADHAEVSALAWIVESGEIEAALQKALSFYGVQWIDDKVIESCTVRLASSFKESNTHTVKGNTTSVQYQQVTTASGLVWQTPLVIAADGTNSVIRQKAGIWHQAKSYDSKALVAQFTVEKPHHNTAFQWFTDEGVLAFLPLPDTQEGHQISMVWSAPNDIAATLEKLPYVELAEVLKKRVGHLSQDVLGELTLRSPMHGFALTLEKSGMVAPNVALVGDAAHRIHPLAGQGLNLGLADVLSLSTILANKESFRSVGDVRVLERYQRERSVPVAYMRWATDGLYHLFNSQLEPIRVVRNLGMDIIAKLPFIKEFLIKKASGV